MTYPEYLALERSSEQRHEFLRGEVWAMAGGTPSHARICANALLALGNVLKGKPCAAYTSDLRVRVVETDRSTYPDATVICGTLETATDDPDAAVNPLVIVEVLSDSTEASDRSEKFAHLQRLKSLQAYILVSQHTQRIEVFTRAPGVTWTFTPYSAGERIDLAALSATLDVNDFYLNPNA